jgi:hypothetical protein
VWQLKQQRLCAVGWSAKVSTTGTEIAWQRAARAKLKEAMPAVAEPDFDSLSSKVEAATAALGAHVWTRAHEQEHAKQGLKLKRKRLDHAAAGFLLEHERPAASAVSAHLAERQRTAQRAQQRQAKKTALDLRQGSSARRSAAVKRLPFAKVLAEENLQAEVEQAREKYRMSYVTEQTKIANVFVVRNVADMPLRWRWSVALGGGMVVTPEFLQTEGQRGTAVLYRRATAATRKLWISDECARQMPRLIALVRAATVATGSKWTRLASQAHFVAAAKTRASAARALVTIAEKKVMKRQGVMTAPEFLKHIACIDEENTIHGMCGT